MNEDLLIRNLWLTYIFLGLPATIVIIKVIFQFIFMKKFDDAKFKFMRALEKKYNCFDFYHFYTYDVHLMRNDRGFIIRDEETGDIKRLSSEELNKKYPDLESGYQKLKKLEKRNPKFEKIRRLLKGLSNNASWYLYCIISWIFFSVCVIFIGCLASEFYAEKQFYDNGKYTTIIQFEKYESLPDWDKNAKAYILDAETINDTYFNKDGSLKAEVLCYIIPDENGKYPILDNNGQSTGKYLESINTNQMYKSFLKICQSEEEIIR